MDLYDAWPYFTIVALALTLTGSRACWRLDEPSSRNRVSTIDGLRGILAVGVFVHHLPFTYLWLRTGTWDVLHSRIYTFVGESGVAIFFMITGFLFWGQLIDKGGKPGWTILYIGRLFRIGPLYLFTISVMLAIAFARTGFTPHEPASRIMLEIAVWLELGLFPGPDVNGLKDTSLILCGVTWSLCFEWQFYASLLPLSLLVRLRYHLGVPVVGFIAAGLAFGLLHFPYAVFVMLFCAGMAIASIVRLGAITDLSHPAISVTGLALLGFVATQFETSFGTVQTLALASFFLIVVHGNTMFGLLATRAAHRLSNISYSIYLTHGLLLSVVFSVPGIKEFALANPTRFWTVGILIAPVLILTSSVAYLRIERPGIAYGRRWAARYAKPGLVPLAG